MELNYFQDDRPNQLISEGPMEFDSAAKVPLILATAQFDKIANGLIHLITHILMGKLMAYFSAFGLKATKCHIKIPVCTV